MTHRLSSGEKAEFDSPTLLVDYPLVHKGTVQEMDRADRGRLSGL